MIGNRLLVTSLVVFLAVGPLHADAFLFSWLFGTTTVAPVVEETTTEAATIATTKAATEAAAEAVTEAATEAVAEAATEATNECPEDNDVLVLLPDKSNCTQFFKCSWGEKVPQACGSGLEYNVELQVCDWPENAGCSIPKDQSEDAANEEEAAEDAEDEEEAAEDAEDDSESPATIGVEGCRGRCPETDRKRVVYLSHVNRNKFCQCSNGTPYLFECVDGLVFDRRKKVCTWPKSSSGGPKPPKGPKRS